MEIVWLIMALTLSVCVLPIILWLWWRIRRLEGLIRRRQHEQEEQLALLLHELIEELELRGNALMNQIERREDQLRALLDHVHLIQMYTKTQSPAVAAHDAKPEKADAFTDSKRQHSDSASVASGLAASIDETSAASDPSTVMGRKIQELLRQGLSTQSIAQRLQVGVGEVEVARNLTFWRDGQTDRPDNERLHETK